jgi:hypothetical protein
MASDCEVRTLSSIGSEIKSWCKQNKVNQTELAAALDVSTMTVRRVWKGTKELTSDCDNVRGDAPCDSGLFYSNGHGGTMY